MTRSERRGFTIIEVVISTSLLAVLVILALGAVTSVAVPTSDATTRSFMASRGNSAMSALLTELEGADFDLVAGTTFCLGDLVVPSTFTPDSVDYASGGDSLHYGRAVRFFPMLGWDPTANAGAGGRQLGGEVILAFVTDEAVNGVDDDGDGLVDEMRLVRSEGGAVVEMLTDIRRGADGNPGGPTAPEPPYFELTSPSRLEINFQIRNQIDYDAKTNQRLFAQIDFVQFANLRNENQP